MAFSRSFTRLIPKSSPARQQTAPPPPNHLHEQSTAPLRSARSPTPPPTALFVPNVFVIPPEEEQHETPPWCCFDAAEHEHYRREASDRVAQPHASTEAAYVAHDVYDRPESPVFHRLYAHDPDAAIVMPDRRLPRESRYTIAELEQEAIRLTEHLRSLEARPDSALSYNSSASRKPRSLRSRAASAFRTMTLGRKAAPRASIDSCDGGNSPSLDQFGHQLERWPSSSAGDTVRRPSRKKSRPLSQLFSFTQSNRSIVNLDARRPFYGLNASTSDLGSGRSRPPGPADSHIGSVATIVSLSPDTAVSHTAKASSPPTRMSQRRISMLNLRRTFSTLSKSTAVSASSTSTASTDAPSEVHTPPLAHETLSDESSSLGGPASPTSEFFVGQSGIDEFFTPPEIAPIPEIKFSLDSLHFESLQLHLDDF